MASSQQTFLAPKIPAQQQVNKVQITPEVIQSIRKKLEELGPGPYTPEQAKQRETYMKYISLENQSNQPTVITAQSSQIIQQQQQQQPQQVSNDQNSANSSQTSAPILDKRALQDLVKEVDPTEQLDEDVEDLLLQVADDFIENVINTSCQLAKHRKSSTLEVKDVQFHLERNFNLWIPGFSSDELKPYKKSFATEAHKQRLQLIKKTSKPAENNPKDKNKE